MKKLYKRLKRKVYWKTLPIRIFLKFFKSVWNFKPYEHSGVYNILKVSIDIIKDYNIKNDDFYIGQDKNIKKMKRLSWLLKNAIEDNYAERCGYEYFNGDITFKAIENSDLFEVVFTGDEEKREKNSKAIKEGYKLEQQEKNELFNIIKKNLDNWWV